MPYMQCTPVVSCNENIPPGAHNIVLTSVQALRDGREKQKIITMFKAGRALCVTCVRDTEPSDTQTK